MLSSTTFKPMKKSGTNFEQFEDKSGNFRSENHEQRESGINEK